jgi:hypothetical protein
MTTESLPQASGRPQTRFNRFLVRWLASPFGVLSGKVVLLRYTGRVSGLPRQLPLNCEPFEGGYLIRVSKFEQKRWWRNFRTPWPAELVRKGRRTRGSAAAVPGTTGNGLRIAADYFAHHHGAARRAGLPKLPKGESPSSQALQTAAATVVFVIFTPDR